ncbi:MAG: signal peptidase II [Bdellovibrionales bacterium]|nr:signal peptidase II [Bdellovibrionales bacterium]
MNTVAGKYVQVAAIVGGVVFLDLLTKYWIQACLSLHEEIIIINGVFNINYAQNLGAAFGFMSGSSPSVRKIFLFGTAAIAIFVIFRMLKRNSVLQRVENIALSLILGGALGNVLNRMYLGYVVDFLHFHWRDLYHFPSFNIADVAICMGAGLLLIHQAISPPMKKYNL